MDDTSVQVGSKLRDAAVDPQPGDMRVLRQVRGAAPGVLMQAEVDDDEFVAEVLRRRGAPDE